MLPVGASFLSPGHHQLHLQRSIAVRKPFVLRSSDVSAGADADDAIKDAKIKKIVQSANEKDIGTLNRSLKKRGKKWKNIKKKPNTIVKKAHKHEHEDAKSNAMNGKEKLSRRSTTSATDTINAVLEDDTSNFRESDSEEVTEEKFNAMVEEMEALARDSVVQIDLLQGEVSKKDGELDKLSNERDNLNGAMDKLRMLLDELDTALEKSDGKIQILERDNESLTNHVHDVTDTLVQVKADAIDAMSKFKAEAANAWSKLEEHRNALQSMLDKALGGIDFAEANALKAQEEAEQTLRRQKEDSKKFEKKMRQLVTDEKKIVKKQMWDLETKLKDVEYKHVVAGNEVKSLKKIIAQFDKKILDLEAVHEKKIGDLLDSISTGEMFYAKNKIAARKRLVGMVVKFQRRLKRRDVRARNNMENLRMGLESQFEAEKKEMIADFEAKISELQNQVGIPVQSKETAISPIEPHDSHKKVNVMDKVMVSFHVCNAKKTPDSSLCGFQLMSFSTQAPVMKAWVSGAIVSLLGGLDTSRGSNGVRNPSKGIGFNPKGTSFDNAGGTDDIALLLKEAEQIVAEVDSILETPRKAQTESLQMTYDVSSALDEKKIHSIKSPTSPGGHKMVANGLPELMVINETAEEVPNHSIQISSVHSVIMNDKRMHLQELESAKKRAVVAELNQRILLKSSVQIEDKDRVKKEQAAAIVLNRDEDSNVEAEHLHTEEQKKDEEQERLTRDALEAEETATRLEEEARCAEIEYLLEEGRIAREAQEFEAELLAEEARIVEEERLEEIERLEEEARLNERARTTSQVEDNLRVSTDNKELGPVGASIPTSNEILKGNVVAQRSLYRFSPTQSSVQSPFAIEECQYFQVKPDESMEPIGDRSFTVHGFDAELNEDTDNAYDKSNDSAQKYITLGPALYSTNGFGGNDISSEHKAASFESSYAAALYCMANPDIVKGKGMQLSNGAGIAGILSVIGAGLATDPPQRNDQLTDEIYDKASAPAPESLSKILFTESRGDLLDKCVEKLTACNFPSSKVELGLLDWTQNVPSKMNDNFNFIIGCDCVSGLPSVDPLVRTVAYSLKSSPRNNAQTDKHVQGKFLHIGSGKIKAFVDLKKGLSEGFNMRSKMEEMVLERLELNPIVADTLEQANAQLKDERKGNISVPVEFRNVKSSTYSALVAHHHHDYNGSNGDIVFQSGGFN